MLYLRHLVVACCALLIGSSDALKILFYSPKFGKSHMTFVGNLADTLHEAGHEVVLYQPLINELYANFTGSKYARSIDRPQDEFLKGAPANDMSHVWQANDGIFKTAAMFDVMGKRFRTSCENQLHDNATITRLANEKFDIALGEFFDSCGFGIFRLAGIQKTIVLYASSMPLDDATYYGLPALPSFVPGWTSAAVGNSFKGRFINTLYHLVGSNYLMPKFLGQGGAAFESVPSLPSYKELLAQAQYYFVNTDELVDFPRPITHKLVNIAGTGMQKALKSSGQLHAKYRKVFDTASKGVIYFSLGSVVQSHTIPADAKKAFLDAFAEFPGINFLWKYEKPEHNIAAGYKNVFTDTWMPQKEIFAEPKLLAFITHGGMNSVTEATYAGIPLVAIPLFGDQPRNALMVEKRGVGVKLGKFSLDKATIVASIRKIIDDNSYRQNAKRIAAMIAAKPMGPDERVVRHVEFAAAHDVHAALDVEARHLSTLAYYSIDVLAILVVGACAALLVASALVVCTLRRITRLVGLSSAPKTKAE